MIDIDGLAVPVRNPDQHLSYGVVDVAMMLHRDMLDFLEHLLLLLELIQADSPFLRNEQMSNTG